jgi:hypothetical protein
LEKGKSPVKTFKTLSRLSLWIFFSLTLACVTETKKSKTGPPVVYSEAGDFTDKDIGFTTFVPAGWERQNMLKAGIILLGPRPRNSDREFRPNVTILSEYIPQPPTSREYFESNGIGLSKFGRNYKSIKNGEMMIGGQLFFWRMYFFAPDGYKTLAIQYSSVVNDRPFTITCTSLPDHYEAVKPTFDAVIKNLRFHIAGYVPGGEK